MIRFISAQPLRIGTCVWAGIKGDASSIYALAIMCVNVGVMYTWRTNTEDHEAISADGIFHGVKCQR